MKNGKDHEKGEGGSVFPATYSGERGKGDYVFYLKDENGGEQKHRHVCLEVFGEVEKERHGHIW